VAVPRYPVRDKTVLITGAARGIGAESARQLAARGARLSLVGLEQEELTRRATECGPNALAFEADVTDPDALERAVEATTERFGGIDVVIANAGIAPAGPVSLMEPEAFERCVEVNLLGVWRTIRACLPELERGHGYLLVIASLAAALPAAEMAAYSATKAGVEAFARALRMEVHHLGIDVGIGYFSWIDTEMVTGADRSPAGAVLRGHLKGPLARTYPVSRAGEAVATGVERRVRSVVVPGWLRYILVARELLKPVTELDVRRIASEAEAATARTIEREGVGAATGPVGAGGAADTRARDGRDPDRTPA